MIRPAFPGKTSRVTPARLIGAPGRDPGSFSEVAEETDQDDDRERNPQQIKNDGSHQMLPVAGVAPT